VRQALKALAPPAMADLDICLLTFFIRKQKLWWTEGTRDSRTTILPLDHFVSVFTMLGFIQTFDLFFIINFHSYHFVN
jgi:hypothetical protein